MTKTGKVTYQYKLYGQLVALDNPPDTMTPYSKYNEAEFY
jgi:hypothetical protein